MSLLLVLIHNGFTLCELDINYRTDSKFGNISRELPVYGIRLNGKMVSSNVKNV